MKSMSKINPANTENTKCSIDNVRVPHLSYSTVVLYIGFGDFGPKLSPQK